MQRGALRHTPAGVAVLDFRLRHESVRAQAGVPRRVELELDAIAFEATARLVAELPLECTLRVEGFLCARSRRSQRPVLHAERIEYIEEN